MSEGPKLTLPSREAWTTPPRRLPVGPAALGIGLAAVLGLQVYLVLRPAPGPSSPAPAGARRPAAGLKDVALRLQRDNLHGAAAKAWEEYLQAADLPDADAANVRLEIGKLLSRAGRHEEALGQFFRASPSISSANEAALNREIGDALGRMGKHAEQGYELRDRLGTPAAGKSAGDAEAGKVVAWIGTEKITLSDLDDRIAREIEERAAAIPGLPPERIAELRAQAQKGFSDPRAKLGKLQEIVAREVLWREGREKNLDDDERVLRRIADFRREAVIEEMVLSALRERVKVSESDLRNYYRAGPERWKEPATARVRAISVADEAKAREVIAAAKTEDDFARLAKEAAADPAARESGGLIDGPVAEGAPIPGLGSVPELTAAIFGTDPGRPTPEPVKLPRGFAVAFVIEKKAGRTPPFEEIREKVGKAYVGEKEAEVQGELVKELFKKHAVSFDTEVFLPGSGGGTGPAGAGDGTKAPDGTGKDGAPTAAPAGSPPAGPSGAP